MIISSKFRLPCQKSAWTDYVALEEAYLLQQTVNNQQGRLILVTERGKGGD